MASQYSWKTPFQQNQEMLETKAFTWRLRHLGPSITNSVLGAGQSATPVLNPARNSKSTNLTGITRLVMPATPNASHSLSSSVLPTASSFLELHQQQQNEEKFLRYQEFELEAGETLGLHSMWSLFLISCGSSGVPGHQKSTVNVPSGLTTSPSSSVCSSSSNSDFIGLFLRKILKPSKNPHQAGYVTISKGDELITRYKIELLDINGDVLYTNEFEASARDKLEVGFWDWKKIVPLSNFFNAKNKLKNRDVSDMSNNYSSDEEALLLLRVAFTLGTKRKERNKQRSQGSESELLDEHSEAELSTRQAANTFLDFVTSSKLQPDIIIEIPNRKKFYVHRKILMDRSQFFSKLLGTMITTSGTRNNLVRVEDVSASTMELILKHIYTGQLEEEWTSNPVTVTELINASEKYGLPALKEFCNHHLVKAANKNNCYKLMKVAQIHNLEQAAEDLLSYASEGIGSNTTSRKGSEESVI